MIKYFKYLAVPLALCGCRPQNGDVPPTGGLGHPLSDGGVAPLAATGDGGAVRPGHQGTGAATQPLPPKVRLTIKTIPTKAKVIWGKKLLGVTPVQLDRPRDSGPVDLIVKLDGHFPIHTRAYTFRNETLILKMVKLEDRMTIFGAKKELPPPATPDGGTTPVTSPAPTPTPPKG